MLRLTRPVNSALIASACLIGIWMVNLFTDVSKLILGFISAYFLAGASMTINDYYDWKIDLLYKQEKPIPSQSISPKEALAFGLASICIGLFLACLLSIVCLLIAIFATIIAFIYNSKRAKLGVIGNCMVALCVTAPFIYGNLIAGQLIPLTFLYILMVFMSNLSREIVKGIADLEEDKRMKIKTLATLYGSKFASKVSAVMLLFAILLSIIPPILHFVSFIYVPLITIADLGLLHLSLLLLRDTSSKNARQIKNRMLLWMGIGLLAFFLGKIEIV